MTPEVGSSVPFGGERGILLEPQFPPSPAPLSPGEDSRGTLSRSLGSVYKWLSSTGLRPTDSSHLGLPNVLARHHGSQAHCPSLHLEALSGQQASLWVLERTSEQSSVAGLAGLNHSSELGVQELSLVTW